MNASELKNYFDSITEKFAEEKEELEIFELCIILAKALKSKSEEARDIANDFLEDCEHFREKPSETDKALLRSNRDPNVPEVIDDDD
jgi:hypothetical protein